MQVRTMLDPTASYVFSSSTEKSVTLFETETGQAIAKCSSGEITTGIVLSTNARHLITTSDKGCIYVWKMPEDVTKKI